MALNHKVSTACYLLILPSLMVICISSKSIHLELDVQLHTSTKSKTRTPAKLELQIPIQSTDASFDS